MRGCAFLFAEVSRYTHVDLSFYVLSRNADTSGATTETTSGRVVLRPTFSRRKKNVDTTSLPSPSMVSGRYLVLSILALPHLLRVILRSVGGQGVLIRCSNDEDSSTNFIEKEPHQWWGHVSNREVRTRVCAKQVNHLADACHAGTNRARASYKLLATGCRRRQSHQQ